MELLVHRKLCSRVEFYNDLIIIKNYSKEVTSFFGLVKSLSFSKVWGRKNNLEGDILLLTGV